MRKKKRASQAMEGDSSSSNRNGAQIIQGELVSDSTTNSHIKQPDMHQNPRSPRPQTTPPLSLPTPQSPAQQQSVRTGTESNAERTFFDPDRHALDPTTEVDGEAQGYRWTESMTSMDIELPLRVSEGEYVRKADLLVDIR